MFNIFRNKKAEAVQEEIMGILEAELDLAEIRLVKYETLHVRLRKFPYLRCTSTGMLGWTREEHDKDTGNPKAGKGVNIRVPEALDE